MSLNWNMNDVALGEFTSMLSYKAESAGRNFIKVNPANTSQTCSRCGNMVEKDLSERRHRCERCGLELDRDHNSSINILGRALPEEAERILLQLQQNGMIAHFLPKGKMAGSALWAGTG